jgi:hypothetical protein
MSLHDDAPFAVLDSEFFTPFDRWSPGPEFRSAVAAVLPDQGWTVRPGGVWTHVHPAGWRGIAQGWKLHVSTLPRNAEEVLRRVAGVLRDDPAAFKFASDHRILDLTLTRNWPREGGGKFITIYPADEEHFRRLGRALADATAEFDGPYVLSDRRVPGTRVVFYRYGEHLANEALDAYGNRVARLAAPSGEAAADGRAGYFQLPDWVADPYGARAVRKVRGDAKKVTLNGRYEIQLALKHSNLGGVYWATDLPEDRPVVIRERRPHLGWVDRDHDCVALLHAETEVLRRMDGTGWTPAYVDAFQVWEHHYLAMEAVKGAGLRDYVVGRYLGRRRVASPRRMFQLLRHLVLQLVEGVEAFHARGIILRDLSVGNLIVRPDRSVCFIDLEYAWRRDAEQPIARSVHTMGFAPPAQVAGAAPREEDDFYAIGAVLVEMCSAMAAGLGLNREGMLRTAEMMMEEVGLPRALLDVARGLMADDPALRWRGDDVRRALAAIRTGDIPWTANEPGRRPVPEGFPREAIAASAAEAAEGVCRFLETSADIDSRDALWPGSPHMHRTNPVSVLYGACGPLEHVRRVRGGCPGAWLDWVERRALPERCPPGLYTGLAGVALTLAECGRADAARTAMGAALESPLLESSPGLYYGAAGAGLAALAVGAVLDDARLREEAIRIGERLERRATRSKHGLAWPGEDGVISSGLASGGSGISLFYTYLGARTGDAHWWDVARSALEFEFAQVRRQAGYVFWPDAAGRHGRFWSPHVSFGAAGVGAAAMRLYACTGEPALREWAERCAETLTLRWTNKLWQDMGYAGYGETLLDMHALTGKARWRDQALRMAEVLLPTQVSTRFGTAFPGAGWARVTSDFGMGASGIALFLHRLAHGGHRAFFPDHLLPGWRAAPPAGTLAATPAPLAGSEAAAPGTSGPAAARRPAVRAPARERARTPA